MYLCLVLDEDSERNSGMTVRVQTDFSIKVEEEADNDGRIALFLCRNTQTHYNHCRGDQKSHSEDGLNMYEDPRELELILFLTSGLETWSLSVMLQGKSQQDIPREKAKANRQTKVTTPWIIRPGVDVLAGAKLPVDFIPGSARDTTFLKLRGNPSVKEANKTHIEAIRIMF